MTELPDPLTPAYCDLRGMEWMPMHGHKLEGSDFDSLATDTEYRAAQRLWWAAWQQQMPAASLPDNDRILCNLAGFQRDPKGWEKVRAMALHGFVKCSDGRLYHRFLSTAAVTAYEKRLKASTKRDADRQRLQEWRDRQAKKSGGNDDGNNGGNGGETHNETQSETSSETDSETRFVGGRQHRTGQDNKKERKNSLRSSRADDDFEAFWKAYPRKVGKGAARKSWDRAKTLSYPDAIIAAVMRQTFDHRERFIPHPATWLNQERWLDEGQTGDPVLRAAGLTDDGELFDTSPQLPEWLQLPGGRA